MNREDKQDAIPFFMKLNRVTLLSEEPQFIACMKSKAHVPEQLLQSRNYLDSLIQSIVDCGSVQVEFDSTF